MQSGARDTGTEVPQGPAAPKKQFEQAHPAVCAGWAHEGTL